MKKNIILIFLTIIVVVDGLFVFLIYYNSHQNNDNDFLFYQYQLQKINEVSDKILNRETVEEAYFYYLEKDTELINEIEQYNKKTGEIKQFFTDFALSTVSTVCQLEDFYFLNTETNTPYIYYKSINYDKMPSDIHNLVDLIVKYSLQRNCEDLIYANSSLLQIIVNSSDELYETWPANLHTTPTLKSDRFDLDYSELTNYFDSTENLLKKLESYKVNLII